MEQPSLVGVRAKLDRAIEHINALNPQVLAFRDEHPRPYRFRGQFEQDTSRYVYRLRVVRDPPPRIGILLGELVHNLRSALDHLVWQLCLSNGRTPGDHLGFPILDDIGKFYDNIVVPETRGKLHPLRGIPWDAWAIIEERQPYYRLDDVSADPLAVVHALWNEDKHRHLLRTVIGIDDLPSEERPLRYWPNEDAGGPEGVRDIDYTTGGPLEHGAEVIAFEIAPVGPDPKVYVDYDPPVGIAFGSVAIRATSLPGLMGEILRLVRRFERFFEGPFPRGIWGAAESLPGLPLR